MSKDDILANEELELSAVTGGQAPIQLPSKFISIFPALAERNYQFYFFGQGISLVGFWLQQVAMGWLVFKITGSPFWVGTVVAVGGIPFLAFSTFAGVLVDKVNKQKLLIWTQLVEGAIAAILGILVLAGQINLGIILVLAFLSGCIGSIDLPARLAFLLEMVGREKLASAQAINVAVFNAARFVGPAIAGILIASFGAGWTFILNAISFLPAIWAIITIRPFNIHKASLETHPLVALKEGLAFSFTNKKLLSLMTLAALMGIFIWPYQTLMPVVAERVFGAGAGGLGSLLSAAGAGSLAGAIFTSTKTKLVDKNQLIFRGLMISCISLGIFAFNHNFILGHLLLFLAGFGTITAIAMLNTQVQLVAPDGLRGRVIAVYLTLFVGMMPVGNALSGTLAEHTNVLFTIGFNALVVLIATNIIFFRKTI